MTEDIGVRVIVERVHAGSPGEGYAVGFEVPAEGFTNTGWFGKTPEEGFVRLIRSERKSFVARSAGLARDAKVLDALMQALLDRLDIEVRPLASEDIRREQFDMFGATRIRQVEEQRNEWQERLTDGHRCEHARTCLDDCYVCPGVYSAGGPACAFDDPRFWVDFENGRRR